MQLVIEMKPLFGRFGGDPDSAIRFRHQYIDPHILGPDTIVLDFEGMAGINSSFANGLIANLVQQHSAAIMEKISLVNCKTSIRALIDLAVQIGEDRHSLRSLKIA